MVRRFGVESIHYTVNTLVKEKVKPKPERKWRAALCLLGYTRTPLRTTFFSALLAAPLSFFLLFAPNKNSSLPTIFLSRYQRNRFPFFGVCPLIGSWVFLISFCFFEYCRCACLLIGIDCVQLQKQSRFPSIVNHSNSNNANSIRVASPTRYLC